MKQSNKLNTERRPRLTSAVQLKILKEVLTVKPIRKIAEMAGCSHDAVGRFLKNVGEATAEYHKLQRNLPIRRILIDEYYVLVGGRDKRVSDYMRQNAGWGSYWVWVAICAETGFILATHVGQRTIEDATFMMHLIRAKLPQDEDGTLLIKPDIVTDGFEGYWKATERVFGTDCNFAQYVKQYTAKDKRGQEVPGVDENGNLKFRARFNGARKINRIGFVEEQYINTARVESTINRFRGLLPRLKRTTAYNSKTVPALEHALSLAVFALNYLSLRENKEPVLKPDGTPELTKAGNPRKRTFHKPPPGMELQAAEYPNDRFSAASLPMLWSEEGILKLTDAYVFRRDVERQAAKARDARLASKCPHQFGGLGVQVNPHEFYVMHHKGERRAMVHKGTCKHAEGAGGKVGESGKITQWFGHTDKESALRHAYRLEPHDTSECRKCCVGEYQKLGRRL